MKKIWKVGDYFRIDSESIMKNNKYYYFIDKISKEEFARIGKIKLRVKRIENNKCDSDNNYINISEDDKLKYNLPYSDYFVDQIISAIIDDNLVCKKKK